MTKRVSSSNKWLNISVILCGLVQPNNSEVLSGSAARLSTDRKSSAGYLNPELYREGIASLVLAKEQAEEMMYRNDVIAQLVTEMPYQDIQNRLLIAGNHKEANRSFFEYLKSYKTGNCGSFDVYKLLHMVQRSREKAMMEATPNMCTSDDTEPFDNKNAPRDSHKPPPLVGQGDREFPLKQKSVNSTDPYDSSVADGKTTPADDSPLSIFKIPILKNQQEKVSSGLANHPTSDDKNHDMISSIRKKPFASSNRQKINSLNSLLLGMTPKNQSHVFKRRILRSRQGIL